MSGTALAFALTAAFVHASWNVLLARTQDPEAGTAVALLVGVVVFAPVAVAVWDVDVRVWPFVLATGIFELIYFALLAAAYRRAELSVVYPLARGTAPVLVLLLAVVATGATTTWRQVLGVGLVATGVIVVRGTRRRPGAAELLFGLPIACCIAAYTLIDKHGLRYATPLAYLELGMIIPATAYAGAIAGIRGTSSLRAAVKPSNVLAGIAAFGAYVLVLAALQRAPAASVAAVRETSVVIAAALAATILRERVTALRIGGAGLVAGGVALISLA